MKAWTPVMLLAAAVAGFAAGRLRSAATTDLVPRTDFDRIERERDEALVRVQRAENQLAAERRDRALRIPDPPAAQPPVTPGPAPAKTDDPAPPTSEAERVADVRELCAKIDEAFTSADGEGALAILRKLADVVPEGRGPAMDLAVRINEDVNGEGRLKLDQYTYYTSLGDTGLRNLMLWAMENPSPTAFRVLSSWSIPWVVPKAGAIDTMSKALAHEKEVQVQAALVTNLAQMNDPRAESLLASILADPTKEPTIRAQIATAVATSASPEVSRALETAAQGDADDAVRSAARAAMLARNPPVDGFLVTTVTPGGAAATAGLRAGDIIVSYDSHPTRDLTELRDAIRAAGEVAKVVVLRESGETTLDVRGGQMGVQGRQVKRR